MVIFDLDGTLYQTHETCIPTLYKVCEKHHVTLTPELEKFLLYTTALDLLEKAAPQMSIEERKEFTEELKWQEIEFVKERGRVFDGVMDLLESLYQDGIEMAICGMGSKEYINTVINRCKLRKYFKYIWHRVEGRTKIEVLHDRLIENGYKAEDCLMIGDSSTDLNAAKGNGVPFIGVSYGYGPEALKEERAVAKNIDELKDYIYQTIIFEHIENDIKKLKKPMVLGINGVDTSGKTIFSEELTKYLISRGLQVLLIHLDDFHNPSAIRRREDTPEGYLKDTFNLQQLSELISTLKSAPGTEFHMDLLDLDKDTYTNTQSYLTNEESIIILEGVMLYRKPLDELFDYKIFLDISFDEVLKRATLRDVPKYGEDFLHRYEVKYIPAQKLYMDRYTPREEAQLVINNENYRKPQIIKRRNSHVI